MASSKERLALRRALHQIEFDLLHDHKPATAAEVLTALTPLATPLGPAKLDQVEALARLAAGPKDGPLRRAYVDQFGCAGVQRFRSRAGVVIYSFQAETFPGHINNLYLIDGRVPGVGSTQDLVLLDAGSQLEQSARDMERARAVLAVDRAVWPASGVAAVLAAEAGTPLADAVIDAGAVRFRPMMLTAAAVVVGATVILFDPIFQGLAISLMAGEIASLLLSRMTVPVLYYLSERKKYESASMAIQLEESTAAISAGAIEQKSEGPL